MAERASVFQGVQIGVETSGSVAADKKLNSLSIEPGIKAEVEMFRPMGSKYPTLSALGKEWVEAKLSGQPTYSEIIYPLSSLVNATSGSVVAVSGSPVIWDFSSANASADTTKTFSIEQGDSTRAHRIVGAQVNSLKLSFSRSKIELDGSLFGKTLTDGITMTSSPTSIEQVPVLPTQVSYYIDDTYAALGTTKLDRVLEVVWELSDRFNPLWVLDASESSYVATVETAPKLSCNVLVEANAAGMGLLTPLRAGDTKFMRIKAQGALIGSTYYYLLQIDMAVKVANVSEFKDTDGVFAVEYEMQGVYDASWGKAFTIRVVNKQQTL
ncbi:MAG: hypothetical protein HPY45_08265 [Anaerolineae bacterium]|nr:hypothetical protein [Anaerolineae bacterium]